MDKGRPQYGVQYRLTGSKDTPCIMNGNSWEDSKITDEQIAKDISICSELSISLKK